jgi:glycosyltransferase EpsF
MPQVMSALDCLVLPSLPGEGFPMTVVEAVAAGTPCIVSENVTAETQMLGSEFVSRCSLSVGDWTNALLHIGRKTSEMRSMGPLRIFQCHLDLESFGKAWRNLYRWNE